MWQHMCDSTVHHLQTLLHFADMMYRRYLQSTVLPSDPSRVECTVPVLVILFADTEKLRGRHLRLIILSISRSVKCSTVRSCCLDTVHLAYVLPFLNIRYFYIIYDIVQLN